MKNDNCNESTLKYCMTIEEAGEYFCIGQNRLRKILKEHPKSNLYFMNGKKYIIKRKQFEKFVDTLEVI